MTCTTLPVKDSTNYQDTQPVNQRLLGSHQNPDTHKGGTGLLTSWACAHQLPIHACVSLVGMGLMSIPCSTAQHSMLLECVRTPNWHTNTSDGLYTVFNIAVRKQAQHEPSVPDTLAVLGRLLV